MEVQVSVRSDERVLAAPARDRSDRRWAVVLTALLLVPLAVSAAYLLLAVGSDYWPTTDWALIELRVRDVTEHAVLVGPYSRFGWNHPGPLLFYSLVPVYRLLGSSSIALHVGALVINAAAIVGIALVAWRRGGLPMTITVLLPLALLTRALGAEVLRDPWNPYLPVLALFLLLLLAWSVGVGDLWMAPFAVGVASFAVQSHVGFAMETLALLATALVMAVVRGARLGSGERRAYWTTAAKAAAVSLAVLLVLWAPPLYGTLVRRDGNLGRLVDFFTADQPTAGYRRALEVLGLQWGPRPEWILGPRGAGLLGETLMEPRWYLAVGLVAFGVAAGVALRRRAWDTVRLAVLVAVGLVVAVYAVSGIVDLVLPYIVRWTWVLGAAIGVLVLRAGWLAVRPDRQPALLRRAVPVAVAVLVVVSVVESVDALGSGTPYAARQAGERSISRQVLAALPAGDGPVQIDETQGGFAVAGLVLQLERAGIPVEITPDHEVVYGPERNSRGGPYRARLVVVSGDERIDRFTPPGPRIAHWSRAQTPAEVRRIRDFAEEVRRLPPGAERDAFLAYIRDATRGPAEEVAVYLASPG